MARVAVAGEDVLPTGPRRALATAVYELYERAGAPSLRDIAKLIEKDNRLPGALSHEAVRAALTGAGSIPRWQNLEALVRVLSVRDVRQSNVDETVVRIHALWTNANDPKLSAATPPDDGGADSPPTTLQQVLQSHGPAALADLLSVTSLFRGISESDIGPVLAQLDESDADLVAYVAGCEISYALDEAIPTGKWDRSVSLVVAAATYRPSTELVRLLADRENPPEGELIALCLACLAAKFMTSSAEDAIRLILALDKAGADYDKPGLLTFCGGMMLPRRLEVLLTHLSAFGLSYEVALVCRGVSLRDLPNMCEILSRLWEEDKGVWPCHSIVASYVTRRSIENVLQLLASSEEQSNHRLMQAVSREIAGSNPDRVLEYLVALKKAARPLSLDRVLAATATQSAPTVAEILMGLAKQQLHDEQTALLTYAREKRRGGLSTIRTYLEFTDADSALKEQVRAAIEAATAA
jgi:hypothetical protein